MSTTKVDNDYGGFDSDIAKDSGLYLETIATDGTDVTAALEARMAESHALKLGDGEYIVTDLEMGNRTTITGTSAPIYNNIANGTAGSGTRLKASATAATVLDCSIDGINHHFIENVLIDGRNKAAIGIKTGHGSVLDKNVTLQNATTTQCSTGLGQDSGVSDGIVAINYTSFNDLVGVKRLQDSIVIGRASANSGNGLENNSNAANFFLMRLAHNGQGGTAATLTEGHGDFQANTEFNWVMECYCDHNYNSGIYMSQADYGIQYGLFHRNGRNNTYSIHDQSHIHLKTGGIAYKYGGILKAGTSDGGSGDATPPYGVTIDISSSAEYRDVELDFAWHQGFTVKPIGFVNGTATIQARTGQYLDERIQVRGSGAPVYARKTPNIAPAGSGTIDFYLPTNWDTDTANSGRFDIMVRDTSSTSNSRLLRACVYWTLDNYAGVNGQPVLTIDGVDDYSDGAIGIRELTLAFSACRDEHASGTLTGGSTTTFIDTAKAWNVDEWEGAIFTNLTKKTANYISSNTSDTGTTVALSVANASGDSYVINNGNYTKVTLTVTNVSASKTYSFMAQVFDGRK